MAHYAQCFAIRPGQCFRLVTDPNPRTLGHAVHCPAHVTVRGTFTDNAGKVHGSVYACPEHADDLTDARAVNVRK